MLNLDNEERQLALDKLNSKEVYDFINQLNIANVIIFGSLNHGEFNEISDVDIAVLSEEKITLDAILDLELFLENLLNRPIDVVDLRSDKLDLFVKINILNYGKILFTKDNGKMFEHICDEVDRTYRENENFIYFRRLDVLS
ncbi:nucleotidyltransferase domain-containing protein [Clostridium sp. YIM B02505]|uniref:Nucleotidyltransferase domain-containing protein n=1 Tax=Clostridium yunnanense TaxID=2800325 RepID=A0ABS1ERT1_9CLOT|nr:nucleotidyltransferase domain-containing protein [Clostridium yunnanense]